MKALLLPALLLSRLLLPAADNAPLPPRQSYLLLDSRVIAQVTHAELRLGVITKHPRNPLFREDQPWEVRFDNLYANITYHPDQQRYHCWYSPFIVDPAVSQTPPALRTTQRYQPRDREMGICYATSRDGLTWEKPALSLLDFAGSKSNNLVARRPHGAGIFYDPIDPDPARRFKLFARAAESVRQMAVAFSPDGLHWSTNTLCPEINVPGDTHNNAFWSPELCKYVGITRMKTDQRLVARTESADFIHWTRAVEILRGDPTNQAYAMPVFRHASLYLGLLAIFNPTTDRTHCELAWSPDTIAWHRIQPGTPFIPNSSRPGDYDWGCVYPAANPVILEHEIRLYYGASNGPHTNWRDGFLALATLRPDGFAGYTPKDKSQSATLLTQPVIASGKTLRLTADITPGGWVRATLLDSAGNTLVTGFRLTATITNAVAAETVALHDQPVRIRLEFQAAQIYAFSFRN